MYEKGLLSMLQAVLMNITVTLHIFHEILDSNSIFLACYHGHYMFLYIHHDILTVTSQD